MQKQLIYLNRICLEQSDEQFFGTKEKQEKEIEDWL